MNIVGQNSRRNSSLLSFGVFDNAEHKQVVPVKQDVVEVNSTRSYQKSYIRCSTNFEQPASLRMVSGTNVKSLPEKVNDRPHDHSSIGAYYRNTDSLRLNTGHVRIQHLRVMMSILQDPIQCGYLLNFSSLEHNAENLCFIMMVSRFRDAVCQDMSAWSKSYTEIDVQVHNQDVTELAANTTWPSKRLYKPTIEKMVRSIWDEFLSDDAVTQICMPAKVAENTKRRMLLLDLYGPDVFAEALLDPLKTINRDVLPRFLASPEKVEMDKRIEVLIKKVSDVSNIRIPVPNDNPLLKTKEQYTEERNFTLKEVINNRILYNEFLVYLQKKILSENLLCIRMINMFEELFVTDTPESFTEATDCAWKIFRYFIANGAPYEVSLHSKHKKEIMISLAKVCLEMFDELKKSIMPVLSVNFNSYKSTDSYRCLWKLMKQEKSNSFWSAMKL